MSPISLTADTLTGACGAIGAGYILFSQPRETLMQRYTAKLLFQYRADLGNGRSNTMRRCEERLILIPAKNADSALRKAKAYAKSQERDGTAEAGNEVHFEFVGVLDLLALGPECGPEEVWYEMVTKKLPSERRATLLPKEAHLNAIYWERREKDAR